MDDDEVSRHKAARRSTFVSVWVNVLLATTQIAIGILASLTRAA
jgi:divalent metal cation (Fe/Co/Zn/Cd) transporter